MTRLCYDSTVSGAVVSVFISLAYKICAAHMLSDPKVVGSNRVNGSS